jgi:hypothetical protein
MALDACSRYCLLVAARQRCSGKQQKRQIAAQRSMLWLTFLELFHGQVIERCRLALEGVCSGQLFAALTMHRRRRPSVSPVNESYLGHLFLTSSRESAAARICHTRARTPHALVHSPHISHIPRCVSNLLRHQANGSAVVQKPNSFCVYFVSESRIDKQGLLPPVYFFALLVWCIIGEFSDMSFVARGLRMYWLSESSARQTVLK